MHRITCQAALAALALLPLGALAAPFAYVPNENRALSASSTLRMGCRAQTLEVSERPRGIAVAPDGSRLFLTDSPTRSLVVVDLDSGKPVASWPLGKSPEGLYISTDGKLFAAAVEEDNSVALLCRLAMARRWHTSRSRARIRNTRSSAPNGQQMPDMQSGTASEDPDGRTSPGRRLMSQDQGAGHHSGGVFQWHRDHTGMASGYSCRTARTAR